MLHWMHSISIQALMTLGNSGAPVLQPSDWDDNCPSEPQMFLFVFTTQTMVLCCIHVQQGALMNLASGGLPAHSPLIIDEVWPAEPPLTCIPCPCSSFPC
jgi:hypothetical protein